MADIPDDYIEIARDFKQVGLQVDAPDPTEQEIQEKDIAYSILEGYGVWTRGQVGPMGPTPMGVSLGIPSVRAWTAYHTMSDDHWVEVDKVFLSLPPRFVEIGKLHFCNEYRGEIYSLNQPGKWRLLGLGRRGYSDRLAALLGGFYVAAGEKIDIWTKRRTVLAQGGISPTKSGR